MGTALAESLSMLLTEMARKYILRRGLASESFRSGWAWERLTNFRLRDCAGTETLLQIPGLSALCASLGRIEWRITSVARRAKRSQCRDHQALRFRIPRTTRTISSNLKRSSLWQRFRRQSTDRHHNERRIFWSFARHLRRVNTFCIQWMFSRLY